MGACGGVGGGGGGSCEVDGVRGPVEEICEAICYPDSLNRSNAPYLFSPSSNTDTHIHTHT